MALHAPKYNEIDENWLAGRVIGRAVARDPPKPPAPICMFIEAHALRNSTSVLCAKTHEKGPICVLLGVWLGTYLDAKKNPPEGF
jgi:hypothetical protein